MNDNISEMNEQQNDEETTDAQQNVSPTFSENFANDICSGLHSVLYKRINSVTINDLRIRDVFTRFIKDVECANSFSVLDILNSAESVVKGKEPSENAGNIIFAYEQISFPEKGIGAKLLNNSLPGIYSLFSIHNGVSIDLDAVGGSLSAAETKRYLMVAPQKAQKLIATAQKEGINVSKAGEVLSTNQVIVVRNNEIIASVDKSVIGSNEVVSLNLGPEHYSAFLSGFNAVCSIALCNCISRNNLIRFGISGDIASVCARSLGYYSALTYLKTIPLRSVFVNDNNVTVAVSRPSTSDGDYLYLLKLRVDAHGMPDRGHFGQLYYYLCEKKKAGIIKDVLPVGENINRVINRLCNDKLGFVSMSQVPDKCFGVIVSVGRGESVSGIKLGYFKNI